MTEELDKPKCGQVWQVQWCHMNQKFLNFSFSSRQFSSQFYDLKYMVSEFYGEKMQHQQLHVIA